MVVLRSPSADPEIIKSFLRMGEDEVSEREEITGDNAGLYANWMDAVFSLTLI